MSLITQLGEELDAARREGHKRGLVDGRRRAMEVLEAVLRSAQVTQVTFPVDRRAQLPSGRVVNTGELDVTVTIPVAGPGTGISVSQGPLMETLLRAFGEALIG